MNISKMTLLSAKSFTICSYASLFPLPRLLVMLAKDSIPRRNDSSQSMLTQCHPTIAKTKLRHRVASIIEVDDVGGCRHQQREKSHHDGTSFSHRLSFGASAGATHAEWIIR